MSHRLDRNDRTGEKAFAAVGGPETAWHREGVALPADADVDEALRLSGTDFEVEKFPLYYRRPDVDGWAFQKIADGNVIVRTDRMDPLGVVGSRYEPLQNRKAFEPIAPIVDEGYARIETAGSLRDGRDVWMLVHFDTEAILQGIRTAEEEIDRDALREAEDALTEVEPYGLVLNNHDGSRKVVLRETAVRVVCANTLAVSLGEEGTTLEVRHTKSVEENVERAAKVLFADYCGRWKDFCVRRGILRRTPLPRRAFERLVLDPVIPYRHLEKRIQEGDATARTETAMETAMEKRGRVRALWTNGAGHESAENAWEAYNALIEFLDHDPDAIRGDERRRLNSLHRGKLSRVKRKVASELVTFARAGEEERRKMIRQGSDARRRAPISS